MEKKSSEIRKRQNVIRVRVTDDEEKMIQEKAGSCSMSEASFMRTLATGFIPRSTVDRQSIATLAKTSGEQGRLGGLLKLAIMELKMHGTSKEIIPEIEDLIFQIRATQTALKELIAKAKG